MSVTVRIASVSVIRQTPPWQVDDMKLQEAFDCFCCQFMKTIDVFREKKNGGLDFKWRATNSGCMRGCIEVCTD